MAAHVTGMDSITDLSPAEAGVRAVDDYNNRRFDLLQKAKRYRLLIFTILGLAATAAVTLTWDYDWRVSLAIALGATLLVRRFSDWPQRHLQRRAHAALLQAVLTGVDGATVSYGEEPESLFGMAGDMFVNRNRMAYRLVLSGTHKGFSFTIAEADFKIWDDEALIVALSAIVVSFPQVLPFPGVFAAVVPLPERRGFWSRLPRGLFELESPEEHRHHMFLTDMPDAATIRMDGMIAALETVSGGWPQGPVRFAVHQQRGYLVLPSSTDRFQLPDLGRVIHYDLDVKPLLESLGEIIALARIASRV